jgi:DNA-binding beta-propeller fold protein YncE
VGHIPVAIAITPDSKTACVASNDTGYVTPISTATNTAGTPIRFGLTPTIPITPDGKTVDVLGDGSGETTVIPITTATNTVRAPIGTGG